MIIANNKDNIFKTLKDTILLKIDQLRLREVKYLKLLILINISFLTINKIDSL